MLKSISAYKFQTARHTCTRIDLIINAMNNIVVGIIEILNRNKIIILLPERKLRRYYST